MRLIGKCNHSAPVSVRRKPGCGTVAWGYCGHVIYASDASGGRTMVDGELPESMALALDKRARDGADLGDASEEALAIVAAALGSVDTATERMAAIRKEYWMSFGEGISPWGALLLLIMLSCGDSTVESTATTASNDHPRDCWGVSGEFVATYGGHGISEFAALADYYPNEVFDAEADCARVVTVTQVGACDEATTGSWGFAIPMCCTTESRLDDRCHVHDELLLRMAEWFGPSAALSEDAQQRVAAQVQKGIDELGGFCRACGQ